MKKKLNNLKTHVKGKFFTLERTVRNQTERYCAKLVSESSQYMTITDVNTGRNVKMNKNTVTTLNCGSFAL
jgi:hypothetical protein